jgi:hypothetical protein
MSIVLLTVWCGQCVAEHRPRAGRLGHVQRGGVAGNMWSSEATVWFSSAMHTKRMWHRSRRGAAQLYVLTDPRYRVRRPHPPDVLDAWCPVHGRGVVSTADVLNQRGRMTLNLLAEAP